MIDDINKRPCGHRKKATTTEIAPPASGATIHPGYIRLPRNGERCRHSGLARSAMNDLILGLDPPVKSLVLSRKGTRRGIRLVHLGSLLEHLDGLMENQNSVEGGCDE